MPVKIDIRTAAVAAIVAANVAGLGSSNVRHRKRPQNSKGDPDPLCLVVMEAEKQTGRTTKTAFIEYPCLVVIVRNESLTVKRSDDWVETAREAIKEALWKGLFLGLDGAVRRCAYDPEPEFDLAGFEAGYDVSGQRFTYRVEETKAE